MPSAYGWPRTHDPRCSSTAMCAFCGNFSSEALPVRFFNIQYSVSALPKVTIIYHCLNVTHFLMLNCLVLSSLIVSEGLRKSSLNATIFFWQNFSLNSIVYIYLLVKFLFCLCFCFFMFIRHQLW